MYNDTDLQTHNMHIYYVGQGHHELDVCMCTCKHSLHIHVCEHICVCMLYTCSYIWINMYVNVREFIVLSRPNNRSGFLS